MDDEYYIVRARKSVIDLLLSDHTEPVVLMSVMELDDGTYDLVLKRTDLIAENRRLRRRVAELEAA